MNLSEEDKIAYIKIKTDLTNGIITQDEFNTKQNEILLKYKKESTQENSPTTKVLSLSSEDNEELMKITMDLKNSSITQEEYDNKKKEILSKYHYFPLTKVFGKK
jgi:hypothetical protein